MDELEQLKRDNEVLYRANCEISEVADTLRAEVERLKKANNDALWCGQKDEKRIAELETAMSHISYLDPERAAILDAIEIATQALRGEVGE